MNLFPEVLFEDNHIIAINKKPGDIVQGDKTGDAPLSDFVKQYIKAKANKPGDVFLGTVHRIDRPVSGIVLFAKTSKALSRMNDMFRSKQITKTYWAVVKNKPPQSEGKLEHFLLKDEARNKSKAHVNQVKNSLPSMLEYKIIKASEKYFLLEVNPHTGRHHQIRAQLSAIGCPIKGDVKYGAERTNEDASIHLHARSVTFIHPVKKEKITITAAPPQENLWKAFIKLLYD